MDETSPLKLPYPECDSPLTKDAADIQQLQTLALAVDDAAQDLWTDADDLLITPDAAILGLTVTMAAPTSGTFINFGTTLYDNSGGALPDLTGDRILIRQQGFYMLWCTFQADLSPSGRIFADFVVNGLYTGPAGYGASASLSALTAQRTQLLNSGDWVSFAALTTTAMTQITFARAGVLRLV